VARKKTRNPEVDAYLVKATRWRKELEQLRAIALDCGLTEEVKWHAPCYTFENGNVVILQRFKEYCALMFFKGALLKDPHGVLERPGEHSQAARQLRFAAVREVVEMEAVARAYVAEAIEIERAGLKVKLRKGPEPIPAELQSRLDGSPALKVAFDALTPGRQRAYILYFSQAKRSATRASRVEKCVPRILDGKGLGDR
jgi:uncharacterized protein YdeI (YjbR/CyaY-like superfamily)